MATPLVKAAWRYLMASDVPAALVSAGLLGSDEPGGPYATGWVFSGDLTGDPFRAVEGTGKCAVVLYSYDHWSSADSRHTLRFPSLKVAVYADDTRDAKGSPTKHDAEERCEKVFLALHPLFHDAGNRVRDFDGLRVISTLQGEGFSIMEIPNGDGAVRGVTGYDIALD